MTELSIPQVRSHLFALPNLDRIIRGLLLVFIFSLPFKGLLFVERNGFIILLVLLGLWCVVHRGIFFQSTPIDLPLVAFVLWVAITIPFASFPLYSLKEFGKLLQQGLVFYAVVFFFQNRKSWELLIWLLVGASLTVSAYGITQFDQTNWLAVQSFLPAEVWLVTYLVMLLPLLFSLAWYEERPWAKILCGSTALLSTCCLLLTQSRAGLVSFCVQLWACAWLLKQRAMVVLAGTVTALLLVVTVCLINVTKDDDGTVRFVPRVGVALKTSTDSFVHRIDIWTFMAARVAEHPIVGIGYGKETSKMLYGQVPEDVAPGHLPVRKHGTHNILLELMLHVGLPGLVLFVWLAMRLGRTIIGGFRLATDLWTKAVLLGASVSLIGLGVRLQFDQMLVGTLAVQLSILMALAMISHGSLSEKSGSVAGDDHRDVHEQMTT